MSDAVPEMKQMPSKAPEVPGPIECDPENSPKKAIEPTSESSDSKDTPAKYRELARDYEKQLQSVLFAAPLAIFVYTLDKVGTIGWGHYWEFLTWVGWGMLLITSGISVFTMTRILIALRAKEEALIDPSDKGKADKANESETEITKYKLGQLYCIVVCFVTLFCAHVSRSIEQNQERALLERKNQLELINQIHELEQKIIDRNKPKAASHSPTDPL